MKAVKSGIAPLLPLYHGVNMVLSRWIDSMRGNRFDRHFMGAPTEFLSHHIRHAISSMAQALPLLALLPLLLLGGCATSQEPPQVKLDQANVLPLAINPAPVMSAHGPRTSSGWIGCAFRFIT